MKISTRVRYAARIMLDLALAKTSGPVLGKDIAKRQGTSQSYLDNIMGPLRVAGLVRTARGVGGGFTLAKPPAQITVSDIWKAMEGPLCLIDCIDQPDSYHRFEQCITRHVWQEANEALTAVFESCSLEDIVKKSQLECQDLNDKEAHIG